VALSPEAAREHGVEPMARLLGVASVGVDPRIMGIGVVPAVRRLLARTRRRLEDFDLVEVNEAFAAQVLANERVLGWDRSRLNVHGGAIALGHPTGFTGVRLLITLSYALRTHGGTHGLIALCGGGGLGIAMILRRA